MKYKKRLEDLQQKTNQDEVVCLPVAYRDYYLEGGENMLADVLEILKDDLRHSQIDHPSDCACYVCHHQEEFKNVFKQQIKEIEELKK